jgi:hypothetical protein
MWLCWRLSHSINPEGVKITCGSTTSHPSPPQMSLQCSVAVS